MRRDKDRKGQESRSRDDCWQSVDAGDPYLESLIRDRQESDPASQPRGATPDPYLVEIARQRRMLESGAGNDECDPDPEGDDGVPEESSARGSGKLRSFALAF